MPASSSILRTSPGDRLVVRGHYLGEPERDGEIVEVLGAGGAPPLGQILTRRRGSFGAVVDA